MIEQLEKQREKSISPSRLDKIFKDDKTFIQTVVMLGIGILLLALILLISLHISFKTVAPFTFLISPFSPGDILIFFGSVILGIATLVLGLITVWINFRLTKVTEILFEKDIEHLKPKIDINAFQPTWHNWKDPISGTVFTVLLSQEEKYTGLFLVPENFSLVSTGQEIPIADNKEYYFSLKNIGKVGITEIQVTKFRINLLIDNLYREINVVLQKLQRPTYLDPSENRVINISRWPDVAKILKNNEKIEEIEIAFRFLIQTTDDLTFSKDFHFSVLHSDDGQSDFVFRKMTLPPKLIRTPNKAFFDVVLPRQS